MATGHEEGQQLVQGSHVLATEVEVLPFALISPGLISCWCQGGELGSCGYPGKRQLNQANKRESSIKTNTDGDRDPEGAEAQTCQDHEPPTGVAGTKALMDGVRTPRGDRPWKQAAPVAWATKAGQEAI